jgi:hypothetical protein
MTKEDAVKELGITETVDYAIPENFNGQLREFIECPPAHFVWSYGGDSIFGFPRPLTESGRVALEKYNAKHGTAYDTTCNVLPL